MSESSSQPPSAQRRYTQAVRRAKKIAANILAQREHLYDTVAQARYLRSVARRTIRLLHDRFGPPAGYP